MNGETILVTHSTKLIEPTPGNWSNLQWIFEGLLGKEQAPFLYAWLKMAIEALRTQYCNPGQALVIAGPPRCGKSLCQSLITEMLGGRVGCPFRSLAGKSTFDAELFRASHLVVTDNDLASMQECNSLVSRMKEIAGHELKVCEEKRKQAILLDPIWRISISLNDSPATLQRLPALEAGLKDKVILFRAKKFPLPVDTGIDNGRKELWEKLTAELPAFVAYLLDEFEIPEEMKDSRFGVATWHNPELLEILEKG